MSTNRESASILSRRRLLQRAGAGFGSLALLDLLSRESLLAAGDAVSERKPHFAPRAKSVIWLFMEGGPSAMDTFDPKPELQRGHGMQPAEGIDVFFGKPGPLMKSPYEFSQRGESGTWVCDQLPHIAKHVDKLALIKSCWAESNNHSPAMYQMNTGMIRQGFPSAGAWVTYGLGSENDNLPGFVVLPNSRGSKGGTSNWGAGFLPGAYQGTSFRASGAPLLNLARPEGMTAERQRRILDLASRWNRHHSAERPGSADLEARIRSYELAYRMQTEAVEAVDFPAESESTRRMYGLDHEVTRPFGEKCLMARRLVERGVRFVQAYCNDEWDSHNKLPEKHAERCAETDKPIAGLLADLAQRGLLEETLVIWGGEFGRMPVSQSGDGRDHNPEGFLIWMAGGGVQGGVSHGETDEIGYKAVVDPVSVHDIHATILRLLGLDHTRLTYFHNGRRYRLTDVAGEVIESILA